MCLRKYFSVPGVFPPISAHLKEEQTSLRSTSQKFCRERLGSSRRDTEYLINWGPAEQRDVASGDRFGNTAVTFGSGTLFISGCCSGSLQ